MEGFKSPPTTAKVYRALPAVVFLFLLVALFNSLGKVVEGDYVGIFLLLSFLVVVVYGFYLLSTVFSFSYAITKEGISVRKTFPTTESIEIPFSEMRRLYMYQSPMEEALGLINVKVVWMDSGRMNSITLHDIEERDAEAIFQGFMKVKEKERKEEIVKKVFSLEELTELLLALQSRVSEFEKKTEERISQQEERMEAVERSVEEMEAKEREGKESLEEFKKDIISSEISLSDRMEKIEVMLEKLAKEIEELKKRESKVKKSAKKKAKTTKSKESKEKSAKEKGKKEEGAESKDKKSKKSKRKAKKK